MPRLLPLRVVVAGATALLLASAAPSRAVERPLGPRQLPLVVYGVEEGLEAVSVLGLQVGKAGSLWIATDEGVVRFDGEQFRTFAIDSGLPSGTVLELAQDVDQTIWAATLRGLARLEGERFVPVELPGSPSGEAVSALCLDAAGHLVVGAIGGVFRCGTEGCELVWSAGPGESVTAVALDPHTDELWFAGTFGLVRWNGRRLEAYGLAEGLPSLATRSLLVDKYGWLWIRQIGSLVALDTNDGTIRVEPDLPSSSESSQIFEDSMGTLWVTSDQGLFRREGDRWLKLGRDQGMPDEVVTSLVEDYEGAVWIGTAHTGLVRWLGRDRFVRWTTRTGLPTDVVLALARSTRGVLGIGTQAGLALVDEARGVVSILDETNGLDAEHVLSLVAGPEGGFFVGSIEGRMAWVDEDGRVTPLGVRDGFPPGLAVNGIELGPNGEVWLATTHGLWRGDGPPATLRFRRVDLPAGSDEARDLPPTESISDLLLDRDGVLWAAGRYGLARLENGTWSRLSRSDGLRDDSLISIAQAGDGAIWIGYREAHGVSELRFDDEGSRSWRHFDHTNDLRHDQVTFVRSDALGRIWVGTTRGLSIRTGDRFASFGRSDGLGSGDPMNNAFHADRDGTVWVGTSRGAVAARVSRADLEPKPDLAARIVSARLGSTLLEAGESVTVPHDQNTLEVALSARTFRPPQEVEFRYRLVGIDEFPVTAHQRVARYAALPPGPYRFEVAARPAGGGWGPVTEISFVVRRPWWSTLPARLLWLALAGGIGFAADRARSRRSRQRRESLEKAVDSRTRELKASREELARKNDELAHLSLTDPLTGLKNRRFAWELLGEEIRRVDEEWATAEPDVEPESRLVFFLIDVDHFKSINDQYGHEIGDEILVEVAERVRAATRLSDIAVRWGGEEFLVIARDLPRSQWASFAARLRDSIAKPPYLLGTDAGPVTCSASLGYAAYPFDRDVGLGWQQVLRLADQALYAVKQTGRDADLGVLPGRTWNGRPPHDLLAAQVAGSVHLQWGNVSRLRV